MLIKIKQTLGLHLLNLPGWHTQRKIVVIESDDWGSIRMPSREIYEHLLSKGINAANDPYARYDCLESNEDLTALFEVLSSVKDQHGYSAVLTANTIVANPDFARIKESDFQAYYYEVWTETLQRYPSHNRVVDLYREGMRAGIFRPQLHGREHLNVNQWLKALQTGHVDIRAAFELDAFGISIESELSKRNNFMAALDYESAEEQTYLVSVLENAADIFEQSFGYVSETFIAPCYIWGGAQVEAALVRIGVQAMQGIVYQSMPVPGGKNYDRRLRFTGKKNNYGQINLVRNASFEPSINPKVDNLNDCLARIDIAFTCHKPAIISSHRLNYIGSLDPDNREKNLVLLHQLLQSIVRKWPDVEFLSSDALLHVIYT